MCNVITNSLINENIICADDSDIYNYAILVILFNLSSILSIILLSIVLNSFSFTLMFLLYFIPIRILIGGFHCKSARNCFISFVVTYWVIILFSKFFYEDINNIKIGFVLIFMINILFIFSKKHFIFKSIVFSVSCIMYIFTTFYPNSNVPFIYAMVLNIILYLIPIITKQTH